MSTKKQHKKNGQRISLQGNPFLVLTLFVIIGTIFFMLQSCRKQTITKDDIVKIDSIDLEKLPDFSAMKVSEMSARMMELMKKHNDEIAAIAENSATPTFENTLEALEFSGMELDRVSRMLNCVYYADTNAEIDSVAEYVFPKLKEHENAVFSNEKLYSRVVYVVENEYDNLTEEQKQLVNCYKKRFVRNGASLTPENREKLADIEKQISFLEIQFAKNLLQETNEFQLEIEALDSLHGLPEDVVAAAKSEAKKCGKPEKWVFTLQKSSLIPFLQYADSRLLREQIYKAYIHRGEKKNGVIATKILNLRTEKAHLLGFSNYASFALDDKMAENTDNVFYLLDEIWQHARKTLLLDAKELQKIAAEDLGDEPLQAWDWWYYSEKLRAEKYTINETELREYFSLENVRNGAFMLANKLWDVTFEPIAGVKTYNDEVEVFEVKDADGSLLGVLYTDYFPREGKRAGAWMDELSTQYVSGGCDHRPIVINVANFTRPVNGKPSLLSIDEVQTLFHEFGHAMHGLFSQCTYPTLAGTATPTDFVELPSQVMEKWALTPQLLRLYAKHYRTGEDIPESLISQLEKTASYNRAFELTELVAAAYLDLYLHCEEDEGAYRDIKSEELRILDNICMPAVIAPRYQTSNFNHIFSFGYEAGYYSYAWSQVLDCDCFSAFKESDDVFNKTLAESYRKNVLERGYTRPVQESYREFRHRLPNVNMLILSNKLK